LSYTPAKGKGTLRKYPPNVKVWFEISARPAVWGRKKA